MASSNLDRAIAGEEVQEFPGFSFPAVDEDRTVKFMGKWIKIYHKTTYEVKVEKDDVSERTRYEVPSGYVCEVAGGNSSSVQFV
jgi:hypothetical protein